MFTLDNPGLHAFYLKNRKREHHHKLPSMFAWDHKAHGLVGEIIDMDKVQRAQKEMSKYVIY